MPPAAYRELAPPDGLLDLVACTWWRTTPPGAPAPAPVLPDGCVDVVCRLGEGAFVAGPDTGPVAVRTGGATFVGVRFRPGCAAAALGVPAEGLRNLRVDLADLWGRAAGELAWTLAAAPGPAAAARALAAAVDARRGRMGAPDPLVLAAVARLQRRDADVAGLAGELGASERQLRRRFAAGVGYGPKTFHRVARLRRLLAAADAAGPDAELARLALAAGYADQAHMTRECAALAGATPAALLAARRVRNVQDGAGAPGDASGGPPPGGMP